MFSVKLVRLAPALKRADEALYFAKGNGRDRTERSDRLYEAPSASPESASGLTT
ncbi:hypothetical protein [Martelella limonii]|uniref:hypothetical protein n=1 Tax=Martelella limonii TaxID=1647649 RepID=UPI001581303D|nr:hypothetical protein [Martelella limonii]